MVLPLYANLEKMDLSLLEAAADLGCRPIKAFWVVTVPLSLPGIIAGCFLVFIPAVGEFVIPDLQIGRAHVCTPVTNSHLVCRLLLAIKNFTFTLLSHSVSQSH